MTYSTWISVQNAKDGRSSQNVIIRNNIAAQLFYVHEDTITVDHNIVLRSIHTSHPPKVITGPGVYGDHNIINSQIYRGMVLVDNLKGVYDLHLKPNSLAIGTGNPNQAPATDIEGNYRTTPIDIGAYARR